MGQPWTAKPTDMDCSNPILPLLVGRLLPLRMDMNLHDLQSVMYKYQNLGMVNYVAMINNR